MVAVELDLPDRAYVKPGSASSFNISLGGQLIISDDDGSTRNTQLDSKTARWRQALILLQLSVNNISPEHVTYLGEQGNIGIPRQRKCSGSQVTQIGLLKLLLIGYFKITKITINCN